MLLFSLLQISLVLGHMEMTSPAPRRSKHHPGYKDIDYSMTAPLGGGYKFPCRGFAAGPVKDKYTAGQAIDVKLGGGATHGGGHCQFALSLNGQNFVTIHTVLGKCTQPERNFSVQIPKNFPSGKAVFAWVWNNRLGNRELYMNCADIEINGGSGNSYTGPELLIANFNVPGKKVHSFPSGFADDFGKDLFAAQPNITIASSGTNAYQPATDQENEVDNGEQQDNKTMPDYPTTPSIEPDNKGIPSDPKPEETDKAPGNDNSMPRSPMTPNETPEEASDAKPSYTPESNKKQFEYPNTPKPNSEPKTKSKDSKIQSKKRYVRDTSKQSPILPEEASDAKPSYTPESNKKQFEYPNTPKPNSEPKTKSKESKIQSKKRYVRDTSKQSPILPEEDCEPIVVPEPDCNAKPGKPSYEKDLSSEKCIHGMLYCNGSNMIGTCVWGAISFAPCSQGTTCHEAQPGQAHC